MRHFQMRVALISKLARILANFVRTVCSTCPEGSALECLPECCVWHLAFFAAEEWFMVADQDLKLSCWVRYNCQERVFGLWTTRSSCTYSNGCFRLNYLVIHKISFQYVLSYTHPVCGFLFCTTLKLFTFSI